MAPSDEASHSGKDNRGFCADKVHRLVRRSPDIVDRTHRIVPATATMTMIIVIPLCIVFLVPRFVFVWVGIRMSAHKLIVLPLVAVRAVILRVAFHPFYRDALASFNVNAIDSYAHEVALLSEGLRCHSGCQDGESFHIQI